MKRFFGSKACSLSVAATLFVCGACATAPTSEKKELSQKERAILLIEIANGALNEGDATGALATLMDAEKVDSSLPELHHSKALAFFAKHDMTNAIVEARKAVSLRADYPDANNTLGKLLMDTGKANEAIAPLQAAADHPLYRETFKPLTNLGILNYRRGDYAAADGFLSRAITAAPANSCVAYYYRGHIRLRESRFDEATKDYDNAGKRMCANFADAHLAVGITYERGRQYELARKKFLEIQQRYPNTKVAEQAIQHLRLLP